MNQHYEQKKRGFTLSSTKYLWNCHNTRRIFQHFHSPFLSIFSQFSIFSLSFLYCLIVIVENATSLFASSISLCLTHLMTLNIFALGITQIVLIYNQGRKQFSSHDFNVALMPYQTAWGSQNSWQPTIYSEKKNIFDSCTISMMV
jgi:hypothetical protein